MLKEVICYDCQKFIDKIKQLNTLKKRLVECEDKVAKQKEDMIKELEELELGCSYDTLVINNLVQKLKEGKHEEKRDN